MITQVNAWGIRQWGFASNFRLRHLAVVANFGQRECMDIGSSGLANTAKWGAGQREPM